MSLFRGAAAAAAELAWPQFRGPEGQGHAAATDLPTTWSETEHVRWKQPLPGEGWSSPVIGTGHLWMTAASTDGLSLRALAVDPTTGKLVHDVEVFRPASPIGKNSKNGFASPTPVLDETHLYVHFGTLGTACLNQADGAIVWKNEELRLEHKEGPGSSPILWRDLVILTCDGTDVQFVAALDKATGKVRWKTPRSGKPADNPDQRKAYSTPLVALVDGGEQLISPGADRVIAYDPESGAELWKVEYKGWSNVPRPVLAHGLLYITTAFAKPELWAIRIGGAGDVTETHVQWKVKKQAPASPSTLVVGRELYMVNDKGIVTCLDAVSGEELWTERLGGNFSASLLYADGKLWLFREDGKSYVVAPGRTYKLLAENKLDGRILATPAMIGRTIFLRTDSAMYRIEK
ncbi:MAG: PQQ-binding-like beta-propeller repeat protein [Planctomycetia bacterium]|nr:PQQ-binding-like beta-propeller repeat protein [Planctomycetia bacterium]